ncbi:hypothetical protein ACF0H5_020864 [Mactra antiquata]
MGRYSSDSEEESRKRKKKKKKRSRSRERSESIESRQSYKPKKSKKKKKRKSRSRSRSVEKYRRSRSRSYDKRSRSYSRERYRHRSRSYSRGRYSRSRSRSRDRRRRRSRSYDSYSRSSRRSYTPEKSKRNKSPEKEDPCSSIPGFAEMTPGEQARIRMHMALKAAAAADEKIKGDVPKSSTTLQDSLAFSQAIQDIESSGFSASSFKSNRGDKKEEIVIKDEFTFGTAGEIKLDSQRRPVLIDVDNEELAHSSLYTDPEEKLAKWIQKLASMRRKKLEGEALT